MSAAALALLIGYVMTGPHAPNLVIENGVARQDEGTAAHLWQLLMGLQLPVILTSLRSGCRVSRTRR